jgi:hypothetical protein
MKVRMYRPGLGDCFLLSFPTADNAGEFHMLIDCGALSSTDEQLREVVRDIKKRTGSVVDVVIATHEHWDHISGFLQAQSVFNGIEFKRVWASWTEEPGNDAAAKLKERFKKNKKAVEMAVKRMPDAEKQKHLGLYKTAITGLLQFSGGLGARSADKTGAAWKNYLALSKSKKYCSPKRAPIGLDEVEDVRVFVLGPPEDPDYIKKKVSKVETYDDGGSAFAAFAGFAAAFADGTDGSDAEVQERMFPFDKRYRILQKTAKRNPFFVSHYGFDDGDSNSWRRIENDWLAQAGELALHLDSYTNNTCFALAIELGKEGKVLLFPGDAQVGNWLSWNDLSWKVTDKDGTKRTVKIDDLLSRTVLYKVGHHGSHNATLRAKGLEKMTSEELVSMIPVHRKTAEAQKWEFPYSPLWEELKTRCLGRVLLADAADMKEIENDLNGSLSNDEIKKFDDSTVYDPLFIEYAIEF